MAANEGVIKFSSVHRQGRLARDRFGSATDTLIAWREILTKIRLIGQDPKLYEGAGFGNLSCRAGAPSASRGERSFLITGSQTGGKACMGIDDFCLVERYVARDNRVDSLGAVPPSSESLTHGAIYDLAPSVRSVFHVHAPALWSLAKELRIPTTDAGVPYGTPAMADEVHRLFQCTTLPECRIFCMAGHTDGIVTFGRTPAEAGLTLVDSLSQAYARICNQSSQLCRDVR